MTELPLETPSLEDVIESATDEHNAGILLGAIFKQLNQYDGISPVLPEKGSAFYGDDTILHPYVITHQTWQALGVAVDHLLTVRELIARAQVAPAFAVHTLLRASLEAASTAVWLAHPDTRTTRVSRAMNLMAKDRADQIRAMTTMKRQISDRQRRLDMNIAKITERAKAGKIALPKRTTPTSTSILKEAGAVLTPDDPDGALLAWQACSGIAHGRPWAIFDLSERRNQTRGSDGDLTVTLTARLSSLASVAWQSAQMVALGYRLHAERCAVGGGAPA